MQLDIFLGSEREIDGLAEVEGSDETLCAVTGQNEGYLEGKDFIVCTIFSVLTMPRVVLLRKRKFKAVIHRLTLKIHIEISIIEDSCSLKRLLTGSTDHR